MVTRQATTISVLWQRALRLHHLVELALAQGLHRGHHLGLSEFRALDELASTRSGAMRVQNLAVAIGLNQSSVSRLAARLEEAGLARRTTCADDRRGVFTELTAKGRVTHRQARATYETVLAKALEDAGTDDDLARLAAAVRAS